MTLPASETTLSATGTTQSATGMTLLSIGKLHIPATGTTLPVHGYIYKLDEQFCHLQI